MRAMKMVIMKGDDLLSIAFLPAASAGKYCTFKGLSRCCGIERCGPIVDGIEPSKWLQRVFVVVFILLEQKLTATK